METYLFKFSACLAVLWLIYILFLEREQMHHLKRFYLLGAFVISLIIPLLTITHYIEPVVITNFETTPSLSPITYSPIEINQVEPPFWNLEKTLYLIYALGALLFAIRFMFNLISMFRRISGNEQINTGDFIYVLLKDYRIPHSFFKYLFFNKTNYESNAIPMEVQLHEETHASQWHSLDIVLIEMLQIVFWFHPLVYLLKHHIKLNHEFLADEAVLNHGIDAKNYQTILLQFSSNTEKYQLSSAINYSSIKKRFTVMKTQTSKTRIWISSLLLLPILAILFYSFAEATYVERAPIEISELIQKEVNTESDVTTYHELTEQYLTVLSASIKGTQFDYSELKILYTKTYQLYKSFSKSEIVTYNILPPPPLPLENTPEKILTISIDEDSNLLVNNKLSNFELLESFLKNLNVPENYSIALKLENQSSPEMMEKTLLLLKKYNLLHVVNSSKTGDQQKKATPKEIADYNTWAKKIHKTLAEAEANNTKEYPIIKLKDLNRYKGIYSKMTTAQKENSQVWPKLPPIPAPSPAPAKTLKSNQNKKTIKPIEIEIDKNNNIVLNGKSIAFTNLTDTVSKLTKGLTIEEKRNYVTPSIIIDSEKNLDFFKKVSQELMKVDIWSNSLVYAENQKKLGLPAKHYHPTAGLTIEEAKAQQEQALKDYKENTKPDKTSPWAIEMGVNEVEVYETPEIKTGFIKINNLPHYFITIDGNTKYYDSSGFQISKEGHRISQSQVNASDLIPGHYITKVYSDNKVVASFKDNMPSNNNSTMDIPSPPMPESTLDFIIKMAKANAKFFNERKSISSDDAITLLKKNPKLNVTSHKTEIDQPLVYMSKKPILIGVQGKTSEQSYKVQENVLPMVNGKKIKTAELSMQLSEIKELTITLPNGKITDFKIKIPGNKTEFIKGNLISKVSVDALNTSKIGDKILVFDIKNNSSLKISPIIIKIID